MWCKICRDGHLRLHFSSHIGCPHLWWNFPMNPSVSLLVGWFVVGLVGRWFALSVMISSFTSHAPIGALVVVGYYVIVYRTRFWIVHKLDL